MSQDVYVLGVAMTHFGKHLDKSVKDLTRDVPLADRMQKGQGQ